MRRHYHRQASSGLASTRVLSAGHQRRFIASFNALIVVVNFRTAALVVCGLPSALVEWREADNVNVLTRPDRTTPLNCRKI